MNKKVHPKDTNGGPIATEEEFQKYPELFLFFNDELVDVNDRRNGVSPLNSECYNKIKNRYESGYYPDKVNNWIM